MRQKIVEAARKRFTHFGYGKTTMAEVAGDCNMSSGNLYRYFPGKLDIADEIAREYTRLTMESVRAAVREAGSGAADKLRAYLRKLLEYSYGMARDNVRVFELGVILRRERPDFWGWRDQLEQEIIAEILAGGIASGEFAIPDATWMAELVRAMTFKFHYPQLFDTTPIDLLQRELDGAIELILRAISGTSASPPPEDASGRRSAASVSSAPATASAGYL